MTRRKVAEK